MSKKSNANHKSNQANANKGTSGSNKVNSQVHSNRSKQMTANKKGNR